MNVTIYRPHPNRYDILKVISLPTTPFRGIKLPILNLIKLKCFCLFVLQRCLKSRPVFNRRKEKFAEVNFLISRPRIIV